MAALPLPLGLVTGPGRRGSFGKGELWLDLEEVLRRFGAMCALTPEEAEGHRELCAAAMARVEEERNGSPGGEDALQSYAAAVAARRFVLRCIACGGTVAIGDPRSGPAGARSAAEALEEDYRLAAGRWLETRGFCFRQVPQMAEAPEETEAPGKDSPGDVESPEGNGEGSGDGSEENAGSETEPEPGREEGVTE